MKTYAAIFLSLFFIFGTVNAATEMEQREAIWNETKINFESENFQLLEKMANKFRTSKSRTTSGLWHLTVFYSGISQTIYNMSKGDDIESASRLVEAKTKKWVTIYPKSPTAHISHALALLRHGWSYRGGSYASKVKPESWAPFYKYIGEARAYLEEKKAIAAVDPRWYEAMLEIAQAEGWEREKFNHLLNEALGREPLFYQTYFMALEYLLPKWHGGINDIEVFAQDAVKRTVKKEGWGVYARIYWFASQAQFDNSIFIDTLASWPHIKNGFDDIILKYPDAWNMNNYAKFACLAQDKFKAKELLQRTELMITPEAWSPLSLREKCKKLAFS